MIAYLEGKLLEQWGNCCIVMTNGGVGYRLFLPAHTLANLPVKGEPISLYTSMIVREDAQELFGFQTFDELRTFEILVTISKVGAKTALAVLSVFRPADLEQIVLDDDALVLTQVPGIGKKTAQHVFLELKDKMKGIAGSVSSVSSESAGNSVLRTVLDGLTGLGYPESETYPLVRAILQENQGFDVSEAIRAALQALSRGKK
ncbi:MAG: Holliday junction branch migration protein RuvA [Desulfovibrionaceae bacterium]|nr:Holliday junction branch migration protein RuvA [Desulfovibrionaceae bacterium]